MLLKGFHSHDDSRGCVWMLLSALGSLGTKSDSLQDVNTVQHALNLPRPSTSIILRKLLRLLSARGA